MVFSLATLVGRGAHEVPVLPHPVAVAADVDDVAVVQQPVDGGRGHDLVAEDQIIYLRAGSTASEWLFCVGDGRAESYKKSAGEKGEGERWWRG